MSKFCCTFVLKNIPRVGIMDWGVPGWKDCQFEQSFYLWGKCVTICC